MTKQSLLAMGFAAVLVSACGGGGGGGGDNDPLVTEAVPANAATNPEAATEYVTALTAVPESTTDTLEPITDLPETLATDDTAEPALIAE